MTTAILAENEAPRAVSARAPLRLPNARLLALGASLASHVALGALAYAHAAAAPVVTPQYTAPTSVEVSVALSGEPTLPAVAAPTPAEERAASTSHAPSTPHSAVAPASVASAARAPSAPAASVPQTPLTSTAPRFIMQAPVVTASASAAAATKVSTAAARTAQDTASTFAAQGTVLGEQGAGSTMAAQLPFSESQVDSPAKLQTGSPPTYTAAAEAAGVEAELPLEIVIDRAGAVESARSLQHVGYGLDEAALTAVRRYRFSPARRAGNPVAVRMRWLLRFQLR